MVICLNHSYFFLHKCTCFPYLPLQPFWRLSRSLAQPLSGRPPRTNRAVQVTQPTSEDILTRPQGQWEPCKWFNSLSIIWTELDGFYLILKAEAIAYLSWQSQVDPVEIGSNPDVIHSDDPPYVCDVAWKIEITRQSKSFLFLVLNGL